MRCGDSSASDDDEGDDDEFMGDTVVDIPRFDPQEFDTDETVILYDYGIELTNRTRTRIDPPYYETSIQHVSLRGYNESKWMEEKLEE